MLVKLEELNKLTPETLFQWLEENHREYRVTQAEAKIVCDMLDGHGYAIVVRSDSLFRADLEHSVDHAELTEDTFISIVDSCQDWADDLTSCFGNPESISTEEALDALAGRLWELRS